MCVNFVLCVVLADAITGVYFFQDEEIPDFNNFSRSFVSMFRLSHVMYHLLSTVTNKTSYKYCGICMLIYTSLIV